MSNTSLHDIWKEDPRKQADSPTRPDRTINRCVDCKSAAPRTNTNFTLISSEHGWRLSFSRDADGRRVPEWRCPRCWNAHKRRDKN